MLLIEAKEAMQRLRTMVSDPSIRIPSSAIKSVHHIGRGSFANVELAWYTDPQGIKKEVAVKRFRLEVLANDMCLQLIANEIDIVLCKSRHRHIVNVMGVGCDDPTRDDSIRKSLFLVQEYLPGGDLRTLVKEQMQDWNAYGLRTSDMLGWCCELASSLAYLHMQSPPIIHRDIKLENLLLAARTEPPIRYSDGPYPLNPGSEEAEIRLIDFGLARQLPNHLKLLPAVQPRSSSNRSFLEKVWNDRLSNQQIRTRTSNHSGSSGKPGGSKGNANSAAASVDGKRPDSANSKQYVVGDDRSSGYSVLSRGHQNSNHSSTRFHMLPGYVSGEGRNSGPTPPRAHLPPLNETSPPGVISGSSLIVLGTGQSFTAGPSRSKSALKSGNSMGDMGMVMPERSQKSMTGSQYVRQLRVASYKNALNQRMARTHNDVEHEYRHSRGSLGDRFSRRTGNSSAADSGFIPAIPNSPRHQVMLSGPSAVMHELTGQTGSLMYMAPEVFRGESYNHKADVFSFAVTCYELIHRQLILSAILDKMPVGASHEEIEVAILEYASAVSAGYRPPLHPAMPHGLRKLLTDCWKEVPTDRPAMDKVEAQLRVILRTEDFSKMDVLPGSVPEDSEMNAAYFGLETNGGDNIPTIPSHHQNPTPPSSSLQKSASRKSNQASSMRGETAPGGDERPSWERPEKGAPACGCILA